MTAIRTWKTATNRWRRGETSDSMTLKATARYLEESADFIPIRDFLLETGMSKAQILDWFSAQDFADFKIAVDEGWGWE